MKFDTLGVELSPETDVYPHWNYGVLRDFVMNPTPTWGEASPGYYRRGWIRDYVYPKEDGTYGLRIPPVKLIHELLNVFEKLPVMTEDQAQAVRQLLGFVSEQHYAILQKQFGTNRLGYNPFNNKE